MFKKKTITIEKSKRIEQNNSIRMNEVKGEGFYQYDP